MTVEAIHGTRFLVGLLVLTHGLALLLSTPAALFKLSKLKKAGAILLCAAFLVNTWIIVDRWFEAGRPPFKTMYETLLFYPWCVALVTLALIWLHRLNVLIPFASAISIAGLAYGLYRPDVEIVNLPPALQSAWFVPHVVTYFVSYAALFASFVLALLSLAAPFARTWLRRAPSDDEPGENFERYAHLAVLFGFFTLTLGLAMGAVWGKYAWGDYWSWDPKENWALVTWLAYLIYLHLRLVKNWSGKRAMVLLVCSFGAVVFTYLGMSMLPTASDSLHVYQ